MNILEFVLLVWVAFMVAAVSIDFGSEAWAKKKAHQSKVEEAEAMLMESIERLYQPEIANVVELKVVALPKKHVGGRHRLSAA